MTLENNLHTISEIIRRRRAVYPRDYLSREIPHEIIEEILENANWAPSHKLTEPWRFKVIQGVERKKLADFLTDQILREDVDRAHKRAENIRTNILRSPCLIVISMKTSGLVPEWEEIAAVAMAVQNMWLTCAALSIGSYWSAPVAVEKLRAFFPNSGDEKYLGLFYMGYVRPDFSPKARRAPVSDKVRWRLG